MSRRSTTQAHVPKPLIAKKDFPVRTQHFHVSIEQKARLRMTVVVLVQEETIVRREVEQTFDCLQVFDLGVVKLTAQLPVLEYAGAANIDSEDSAEYPDVPKCEPVAYKPRPEAHYFSSALRRTKPSPRTVCSSFTRNGSSSFLRILATCTSITLSRDV